MAISKTRKNKQNALTISTDTYNEVYERDNGSCILCMEYGVHEKMFETSVIPPLEMHHYITRARLGMGIPKNLVMLCKYHHLEETKHREKIKKYLKNKYEDWNEEGLRFKKYE